MGIRILFEEKSMHILYNFKTGLLHCHFFSSKRPYMFPKSAEIFVFRRIFNTYIRSYEKTTVAESFQTHLCTSVGLKKEADHRLIRAIQELIASLVNSPRQHGR